MCEHSLEQVLYLNGLYILSVIAFDSDSDLHERLRKCIQFSFLSCNGIIFIFSCLYNVHSIRIVLYDDPT